jgi:hypothetical protein
MLRLARKFLGFRIMSGCQRRFVRQTERFSLRNHTPYVRMNETSSVSCNTILLVTQNVRSIAGVSRRRAPIVDFNMLILNGLASSLRWAGLGFEARRARTTVLHSLVLTQDVRSRVRYWMASARCLGSIDFPPSKVGDCPCDLQDTVISSGSQTMLCHCAFLTVFRSRRRARRRHECNAVPFERCNRAFHVAKKKIVLTAIRELA